MPCFGGRPIGAVAWSAQSKVLVETKQLSQSNAGVSRSINEQTGLNLPKGPTPLEDEVNFEENQLTTTHKRKRPYGSNRETSVNITHASSHHPGECS
ncbi:hypothetical protein H4Q26_001353 [Puccinia striiformis f. sp. tritici PST-130]|nr:hypothetical protein H4Q26_001353 [Puccinia striiformis f. sp. tritici PST-130]